MWHVEMSKLFTQVCVWRFTTLLSDQTYAVCLGNARFLGHIQIRSTIWLAKTNSDEKNNLPQR